MTTFWDFFWFLFWTYIFVSVIIILIRIFADIFRDNSLNGWAKALWVIFLVFLPFLGALIYLVARGRGMSERAAARASDAQQQMDSYIRTTAAGSAASPTEEIAKAKALLDSGAITQGEYEALKAKTLAGQSTAVV